MRRNVDTITWKYQKLEHINTAHIFKKVLWWKGEGVGFIKNV